MLAKHLAKEFNEYFDQDPQHDTMLWFDPHREWEGLLPHLKPHLPLLVFEGSQLQLRHRLASRSPGERFVVYLPMALHKATYLRPFFYTSKCFERSIEAVLHDLKIPLPDAAGEMRSIRPLLPALAVASVGKGKAFWTSIVNLETALGRLIPDFEDLLLRLLASPITTVAELKARQVAQPFLDLLEGQFGVAPPEAGEEDAWADRFTATLCLVDTYLATGKPSGFPFESPLPTAVHWERCRNFLRKWQRDDLFKAAFAQRARTIDGQYSLAAWVKGLPQPPETGAFLNVERALWEKALHQLDSIADKSGAVAFCRKNHASFHKRAQGFWAREGSLSGWSVLDRMAEVVIGARDALKELSGHDTAQHLIERYTGAWWQVDRAYRLFRGELDRGVTQADAALKWAQRMYEEFLEAINARFGEALMQEGQWPPAGTAWGAGNLWADAQAAAGQARRGIILADALRHELGQALAERLRSGPQAGVERALCPLPSITALGMAALLPGWPSFEVDYAGGQWVITAPGFEGNVATKAGRLAWLERRVGSLATFDLDTWLTTPLTQVPKEARWIVISSTEIDAVGEGAATVAWHAFDGLLDRLDQAVRRLLALGCAEVHVVSDHGFLLRESIRESDKVAVKAQDVLKKAERYLVGRNLPPTDLPAMPVPGSDGLVAWFPRGIGCFATPGAYNYMHGGISLQELVTAHVTVQQAVTEHPVGVSLELVTGPEIRNAIFKVRLVPQGVDLWSRARQVTLDIAREGKRVSPVWEAEVGREIVEKSLRLEPDSGLAVGDAIAVRVWDAVTGELLAQQPATVYVDLNW
jgi:hypothetical protein